MSLRAETGVAAGSPTVVVDGVTLAYERRGAGPPVVCLHAIGHGARDFDAFAASVEDRFEVFGLDWPGQGRSGDDRRPASPARYAALLEGWLDALGLERPLLVGCSIGGAAAICVAASRPVRALVLCDTGGLVEVDATARQLTSFGAGFFAAGARRAGWFGPLFAAFYRFLVLPSSAARDQRRRIVAAGYETAEVTRQAWQSFGQPDADLRDLARRLTVPVWFAWARHDRVIPLSLCRQAIAATPGAALTTYDAGHAAFLEEPKAFARDFLAFADGLDRMTSLKKAARAA